MPEFVRVALAALAVYRVAQLVSIDYGPFDVFQRHRDWAGVSDRGRDGRPYREYARLISCPYCVGLWISIPVALAVLWPFTWSDAVLIVLGLAGAQAYMQGPRHAK